MESLRVDHTATATQVKRMQAKRLIRDLEILNRVVEFIRYRYILFFLFLFYALKYLHARKNEEINYNFDSASLPLPL